MKIAKALVAMTLASAIFIVGFRNLEGSNMSHIKIDVGHNIHTTAKNSGIPKFTTRDVAGMVSYSVVNLPSDVHIRYVRTGYEGSFAPLFALTLYADHEYDNNLAVSTVVLQFSTDQLSDHAKGRQFVDAIKSQFMLKKWARYIPDLCPAVIGRSSFLDIDGAVKREGACPLDPAFDISPEEWAMLAKASLSYQWIGDGVLASLSVTATEDRRGITYRVELEYADYEIAMKQNAKNQTEKLAYGDSQGWDSTVKHKARIVNLKEKIGLLEANAVKRGDQRVARAQN